jgi:stage II sporulation protein AA (anti-sigma F factor antagonist)
MRWEDQRDGRHVFLEGELDHEACDQIAVPFRDVLAEAKGTVIVSLHKVPFVSSKGIWLLLESRSKLLREGRKLLVQGLSPHVRKTFETVGVFKAAPEWDA